MAPRWNGKDAKAEAFKEPMSKIVSQLQSSLVQSDTCGFFSGNSVHIALLFVYEPELKLRKEMLFHCSS